MANREGRDPLKEHELAKKLVKGPDGPANITHFTGYVGSSPSKDTIRLYLNLDFDEYLDVPRKSILHAANVPEDVLQFGGTILWINKDKAEKIEKKSS